MNTLIKQLSHHSDKQLPFILFSLLALFVWYGGAYINLLAQPEKRLYTILALLLTWFLGTTIWQSKSQRESRRKLAANHPELAKKLQALSTRFQNAVQFLKKTTITQRGQQTPLAQLPWYLFIGTPHSGKTTLLANANMPYVLARKFKQQNLHAIAASESCDWWVTQDIVMVDVPGTYIHSRLKQAANSDDPSQPAHSPHHALWTRLLSLLKQHRGKDAISGVVIALPLPELIAQQHHSKEQIFLELKQRCVELCKTFGKQVSFHLVITKCDLIPGFVEFFSDSGADELSQAWGIKLLGSQHKDSFIETFVNRFNALIKRLNKQLIWRLHQERNASQRPLIKDFPLHVERLKETLLSALRTLSADDTVLNLQGIYLTSAVQIPAETKPLNNLFDVSAALQTTQLTQHLPLARSKSYFIRQLLLRALPVVTHKQPTRLTAQKVRRYAYGLMAVLMVVTLSLTGKQFYSHQQNANALKAGLAHYQQAATQALSTNSRITHALPLLQALQAAMQHNAKNSSHPSVIAYHDALQKIILPEIRHELETALASNTTKNPQDTYALLKAYLMLDDASHYEANTILTTLQQIDPTLFTATNSEAVTQQLHTALNEAWKPQILNTDLIHEVRKNLLDLIPAEITYGILKSLPGNSLSNTVPLEAGMNQATSFLATETVSPIPRLFTAANFAAIYSQQIPAAAAELVDGNWVLGTDRLPLDSSALIQQVQSLYVTNYINAWDHLLDNLQLSKIRSLAEIDQLVMQLSSKNSPLLTLLQTIQHQTGLAPITARSPKLAAINTLVATANKPGSELNRVMTALAALHTDLQSTLQSADVPAAAFQAANAHLRSLNKVPDAIGQLFLLADKSPAPLHQWLDNIASTSWHFVLQETAHFIDRHWQAEVMAFYNAEIANRYPFVTDATAEVSLAKFTQFLGTDGILSGFFETYLQTFADNTNKNWTWKIVHHEHLPFTDQILNQLQHATHIQHAFFADDDDKPQIRFALQPLKLSANTRSLQLNIDGQEVQYHRAMPRLIKTITWPGSATRTTQINLVTDVNAKLSDKSNSEWAWFRIVGKSTDKIMTPKKMLLTVDVDGHQATMMLYSIGRINAFLPSNLQQFKLPEQLWV